MSLIHKALRKAEEESKEEIKLDLPVEEFIGKKQTLKEQLTPRTIVLLVLAFLSLGFLIYKKIYLAKAPAFPNAITSAITATEQPATTAQQSLAGSEIMPSTPTGTEVEDGKKLFETGKLDEALGKFLAASLSNPLDAVALNNIGLIYKKKNNFSQAEGYYKKALAIKADYPECLNNIGVLKSAMGETLEAAIYLKKAIASDNTYADAYFNLAVLNDNEGNFREAIANYKSFLQYTDSNDESLLTRIKERVEGLSE